MKGLIKLQKAMMSLNKYERCTFQSQNTARIFLCVSEGNRLSSEMCRWHFHFILPIMPDKTETVLLLCTAVTGEYAILSAHEAENEFE